MSPRGGPTSNEIPWPSAATKSENDAAASGDGGYFLVKLLTDPAALAGTKT
jgi:hypothetical protein